MDKLRKTGRIIYSIGIIGLAILCFISKDFIIGRPPAWPATIHINPLLAYLSGTILIFCALGVIFNKRAMLPSTIIAVLILLLSVLRHLPVFMNDWANGYKALALFGGSLVIAGSFFLESSINIHGARINKKLGNRFVLTGTILLAAFFIACGYAHFKFADFVKDFIPAYIPFRPFWTYFCGICLFAGGIGLIIPQTGKWAALLSGIMVAGWFMLLHIPRFFANMSDGSDRLGLFESLTFAGIFFVLTAILSRNR